MCKVTANLLSNGLKFVDSGKTPEVSIRVQEKEGWVRVEIIDKGIGISSEYHGKIFEVFERLHQQGSYAGTGVGLAIVRRGIEKMGGRVGLTSVPQQGSTFWFELPRANSA